MSGSADVPGAPELAALARRLGYDLDPVQVAALHDAVTVAEAATARLRARPLPADASSDPAHGDHWLRP